VLEPGVPPRFLQICHGPLMIAPLAAQAGSQSRILTGYGGAIKLNSLLFSLFTTYEVLGEVILQQSESCN
jgi:hypothetical protein